MAYFGLGLVRFELSEINSDVKMRSVLNQACRRTASRTLTIPQTPFNASRRTNEHGPPIATFHPSKVLSTAFLRPPCPSLSCPVPLSLTSISTTISSRNPPPPLPSPVLPNTSKLTSCVRAAIGIKRDQNFPETSLFSSVCSFGGGVRYAEAICASRKGG